MKNKKKLLLIATISVLILIISIMTILFKSVINPVDNNTNIESQESENSVYTLDFENVKVDDESDVTYVNNIIVIYFKTDTEDSVKNSIVKSINGTIVGSLPLVNQYQIEIEPKDLNEIKRICNVLEENECISTATYDEVYIHSEDEMLIPKDPWKKAKWDEKNPSGENWWAEAIQLASAWSYNDYFSHIKIGVVDSGFDTEHEDLVGRIMFPTRCVQKC